MAERIATVEAFLESQSPERRQAIERLRAIIREEAPQAEEKISYQQPTYMLHGWFISLGAAKNHLSFYPMNNTTVARHAEALKDFKTLPGTIQFTPDHPIPEVLVRQIVRERLAENLARKAEKDASKAAKKAG
ncbi:MAG: DUF1801 domain-containing protein [Caulobacteraceae bacterium]|nr:DUF1801 domain-containing protein [Caulobacteraceae bacterium]